jgi:hypothetical protein
MTLESLGNELAKLLADIIHSQVSSKLKKTADRIRGSCLRCDGPLAIVELGSSGKDVVALLAVLNETVLRVGSLEFNLSRLITSLALLWVILTVSALHKRDAYFWSLGSTWSSVIARPIALVIMSFGSFCRP